MNVVSTAESLSEYDLVFSDYINRNNIPRAILFQPEYIGIKCANSLDYFETCHNLASEVDSQGIWELKLDERLLATAGLKGRVTVGEIPFNKICILESKPDSGSEAGMVEYTEFNYPDLSIVEAILVHKGIKFEYKDNDWHRWLSFKIDGEGREIKFNKTPLVEEIKLQQSSGLMNQIKKEM